MDLVDNDTFLTKLSDLFAHTTRKGSVWLTHKRYVHEGEDIKMNGGGEEDGMEFSVLLRATDGHTKFSTRISPNDLEKYHSAYGTLLKKSMSTLRKRDRKREKLRADLQAQREKRLMEDIKVDGPKRGNGRRKRQRQVKALRKQQEQREVIQRAMEASRQRQAAAEHPAEETS
ncbi:signal recognition particle SRP9/SRP14 subunit [Dacryopinax primogenitus]|uniref:Signal recognition particle subunit SRP14 n=1 Tax=Dacryopinax primogenitus (strain DJM 731) TaxID=1858805 RepID=M5FXE0_DACPD|nr:signal recognition particle SRP9/SRP14 subunit [Dacryopinax primogenitus]EJU02651.1 signal recognition particle SRP9/SRP14 subunit [Dacryopinax primogenitus]